MFAEINTAYPSYLSLLGTALQRLDGSERTLEPLDTDSALETFFESQSDPSKLYQLAAATRTASKGHVISFSSKAFVSVTTLCADTCTYCTYKTAPKGEPFMSEIQVTAMLKHARSRGCVEALLVAGERPEQMYDEAAGWLDSHHFASTPEYIARCSEIAIENGMFPHTNAGNLSGSEINLLAETNASIGMMLENSSERLAGSMMPHQNAPSKSPKERIGALERAGRAGIPTTTGILVGIGETPKEAIESIATIKKITEKHGHIQEVIIQNFQPKPGTAMQGCTPADPEYFARIVALARLMMPEMNIQAPPNLSPNSYHSLIDAGINDWGGISPVTPDHVNPEFAWPQISEVRQRTENAGFEFKCRFPTYPEYLERMPQRLRNMAAKCDNGKGYVASQRWQVAQ